jgi:hypothetical protein
MSAPHRLLPHVSVRCALARPVPVVRAGLSALLQGGVLPEGIQTVQFVCARDEARDIRITVIALHGAGPCCPGEIPDGLRVALERCFLRCLNGMRPGWTPVDGQVDLWEWSTDSPDALRYRRRARDVRPPTR